MRYILTILAIICSIGTQAQSVRGNIIDGKSYDPIGEVLIANKRTAETTHSDSLGRYTINAQEGDLLIYYRLGYYTKRETAHITKGELPMLAMTASNMLEEVEITGNTYKLDSIERSIIYRKPLKDANETVKRTYGFGVVFEGLIGKLASRLTGREKRVQRFKKQFEAGERDKFIATKYTITLVTKVTPLTGEEAGIFIDANPMPYDFARAASDMELQMWVRNQYNLYKNKPKVQD